MQPSAISEQAIQRVLLGNDFPPEQTRMVRAFVDKKLVIKSPSFPKILRAILWAGHIGVKFLAHTAGDGDRRAKQNNADFY